MSSNLGPPKSKHHKLNNNKITPKNNPLGPKTM